MKEEDTYEVDSMEGFKVFIPGKIAEEVFERANAFFIPPFLSFRDIKSVSRRKVGATTIKLLV